MKTTLLSTLSILYRSNRIARNEPTSIGFDSLVSLLMFTGSVALSNTVFSEITGAVGSK
ncbi:hypothetical protein [Psychroserpens burtonensis]|uniref:hypothetical protein n=1 Tax=Psychroserpens burtonensis TaxID=49278 RepID=UPI0012FCBD58|nr:hypothetical protein [Psychroserpens burtonensis]